MEARFILSTLQRYDAMQAETIRRKAVEKWLKTD